MTRKGFTLIEAVVAMALAAAGFAGIYELYAGAARAERLSNEYSHAAALADGFLAIQSEPDEGRENGYAWTISREASGFPGTERVRVEILTPSGRTIAVLTEIPAERAEAP